MYIYMNVHTHLFTHIFMHKRLCISMHLCIHIYTYLYVYIQTTRNRSIHNVGYSHMFFLLTLRGGGAKEKGSRKFRGVVSGGSVPVEM